MCVLGLSGATAQHLQIPKSLHSTPFYAALCMMHSRRLHGTVSGTQRDTIGTGSHLGDSGVIYSSTFSNPEPVGFREQASLAAHLRAKTAPMPLLISGRYL